MAFISQDIENFCTVLTWLHHFIPAALSAAHLCCRSLVLPHPRDVQLGSDLVTGEATEVNWAHCHVHETSLRLHLHCETERYPDGSSQIVVTEGCTRSATILGQAAVFRVCQENIPHIVTPPAAWTTDTRRVGSIDSSFWSAASAEIRIHQTRLRQSSTVRCCEPVSTAASGFSSWLTGVEPDMFLCCCSPSASKLCMCILRSFPGHRGCK